MSPANTPNGRFDLPKEGSSLKDRDKNNQLPGRIGTMRGWMIDAVRELRGLDFTEKKLPKEKVEPAKKPEEPKAEEKKDKKKEEPAEKKAA